jgi:hypothetical protein
MAQYIESLEVPPVTELPPATPAVDPPEARMEPSWAPEPSWVDAEVEVSVASYQAYQILYYAFAALFAIAGLDKFLHILAAWEVYVSPPIARLFHISPGAITGFVGIIELLAATAVALKPRIGSWVVTGWLGLIIVNLLMLSGHYDTLVFSLALMAAGFAFTRLSAECN